MAIVREKVKLYVVQDLCDEKITLLQWPPSEHCSWAVVVGETEAEAEYDTENLIDPRVAELAQAEEALQSCRAKFATEEKKLLDRIQSLRALPNGVEP